MQAANNEYLSSHCKSIDKYLRCGIHRKRALNTLKLNQIPIRNLER